MGPPNHRRRNSGAVPRAAQAEPRDLGLRARGGTSGEGGLSSGARDTVWLAEPEGLVSYEAAYDAMHDLARLRVRDQVPDTLVLLEHPPVFTAGRRADPAHILWPEQEIRRAGAELRFVDRGGSVTFHGPGQLVGYPILDLGRAPDVVGYLRKIEEVVIRAASDVGVTLGRDPERTGAWAGQRKVCAIGVRVARGRVTLHGFALNCTTDLRWFGAIVPCGLEDRGVASLSELAGREVTVREMLPLIARHFGEVFGRRLEQAPQEVVSAFRSLAAAAS